MSMPRPTLYTSETPSHNRLPPAGSGIWLPLIGSLSAGIEDQPSAVAVGSGHLSTPWSAVPSMYTLPTANATAGLGVQHEDELNCLDSVMTLAGLAAGVTLAASMELAIGDQATTAGTMWCYGSDGTAGYIALQLTTSEVPQFSFRGTGASNSTATPLTLVSGDALSTYSGQGRFAAVLELQGKSATTVDVRLLLRRAGQALSTYAATGIDLMVNGATAVPGRYDSATVHYGLTLGARRASGGTINQTLGNGTGHVARMANFAARKFSSYSAAVAEGAITSLIARPGDYPLPFLD